MLVLEENDPWDQHSLPWYQVLVFGIHLLEETNRRMDSCDQNYLICKPKGRSWKWGFISFGLTCTFRRSFLMTSPVKRWKVAGHPREASISLGDRRSSSLSRGQRPVNVAVELKRRLRVTADQIPKRNFLSVNRWASVGRQEDSRSAYIYVGLLDELSSYIQDHFY